MAVLVGNHTKLIVQGITGREGLFHAKGCRDYGTNVVGGVTPGKGGTEVDGFPVFNTVKEAVAKTGANATMIFVPPGGAADGILEALEAGIELIVCITEGIPVLDMVKVTRRVAKASGYGYEARFRRRIEPASASLVHVAEGFSPTASDFDVALRVRLGSLK